MTTESRLRDALSTGADAVVPDPEAWSAILRRAQRGGIRDKARRIALVLIPVLGLSGVGVALGEGLLSSGSQPTAVEVGPPGSGSTLPNPSLAGLDWRRLLWAPGELNCSGSSAPDPQSVTVDRVSYLQTPAGEEAVVQAHCDFNTPPTGLFAFRVHPNQVRLSQVLFSPRQGDMADLPFSVSDGRIRLQVGTYDAHISARCCPDHHEVLQWTWSKSGFGASRVIRVLPQPIAVTVSSPPQRYKTGDVIPIRILVRNAGHAKLTNFFITGSLPAGLRWVSGTSGCLALREAAPSCGIGSLTPGQAVTLQVTVEVIGVPIRQAYMSVSANTAPGSTDPFTGHLDPAGTTVTTVARLT